MNLAILNKFRLMKSNFFQEPHSLDHKVPYEVDPELQAISNLDTI
jgi:hypothetical protein